MSFRAVVFDLGGVVLGAPRVALARFERESGLAPGALAAVMVYSGAEGAWARLERGELSVVEFETALEQEARALGHALDAARLLASIDEQARVRPRMLAAVRELRARGLAVAALTNNWRARDGGESALARLRGEFDVFVESCVVGMRKPELRVYAHVLARLGVEAAEAVFLDDLGQNLKPARELGMTTIKVGDPDLALAELGRVLGAPLGAGA